MQIAVAVGARVIATASEVNRDYLRSLGAEPVTHGNGLVERISALGSITASSDTTGSQASVAATVQLPPDLTRAITSAADANSHAAGIAVVGTTPDRVTAAAALAEQGIVKFVIQDRIPLAGAGEAWKISKAGHVRGKLILAP